MRDRQAAYDRLGNVGLRVSVPVALDLLNAVYNPIKTNPKTLLIDVADQIMQELEKKQ